MFILDYFKLRKEAKKFRPIQGCPARINWTDTGGHDDISFILMENGNGERKIDISATSSIALSHAKTHSLYVGTLFPWLKGLDIELPTGQLPPPPQKPAVKPAAKVIPFKVIEGGKKDA